MASERAGDDNNQPCTKSELLSTSLALALKQGDVEKFLQIYDSSIPNSLGKKKVEEIKERARELSEKSTEELSTLRADLKAGQNLISEVFHNVGLNGYYSVTPDDKEKARQSCGSIDRNHNLPPRSGSTKIARAMTLKTDEKEDTSLQAKETDVGAIKTTTSTNALKGQSLESGKRLVVLDDSTSRVLDNNTMYEDGMATASGFADHKNRNREVDDKIQFGSLKKNTETPNNVIKMKSNIPGKKRDTVTSENKRSRKDVGPYPAEVLLKASASLIVKPKDIEVKNCPHPEPITLGQVSSRELGVDEATPILGPSRTERVNKSPLKRHGEKQIERELEDVYANSSPAVSPTVTAFSFQNYGSCNNMHDHTSGNKITRDESNMGDGTRKKKRKKKKKAKQGDNGTESTTEGEEARSPPNGVIPQVSSAETDSKRKTSAESSSERENLSGENDGKVFPGQKASKHSIDNTKDIKSNRTKTAEAGKKKKAEAKKKKGNEETSSEVKKKRSVLESEAATRQKDEEDEERAKSELEEDVFASLRRRRAVDDSTDYGKDESEPDRRAAMSDPGENDEDHGGFNIVKNRKSRRREKGTSHFGFQGPFSKNFWTDYPPNSNFGRGKDPAWDLRKSSSLPKEMCNYTNSRRRLGTNETEELVSTTTTTTTASSRRDSLESDENSYDQKKLSGFSYASRLKANIIQGSGHVQSTKEGDERPSNLEGTVITPLGQSNSKPKMNSTTATSSDVKSDIVDRTELKSSHLESKELVSNVPSNSISTAMNLDVSPTRKFDLNFPNLTSSVASSSSSCSSGSISSSKGGQGGSSENQAKSVQYLDLECTNNSYAGRVKQSLSNNSGNLTMSRDDQSIRTIEGGEKSTIGGINWPPEKEIVSSGPREVYSGDKESSKLGTTDVNETKDYERNLPMDNRKERTSSVTDVDKVDEGSVHVNTEEIDVITTNSQPLPLNAGVPPNNPIWFGSLIVSEDGILDLDDEFRQPESLNGSSGTEEGLPVVIQRRSVGDARKTDEGRSQGGDEIRKDKSSEGNVLMQGQVVTGGELFSDRNTVVVELLSAKKVTIDLTGTWSKTRKFNHGEITEMLLKDWEATVKQSLDRPDSVSIASD